MSLPSPGSWPGEKAEGPVSCSGAPGCEGVCEFQSPSPAWEPRGCHHLGGWGARLVGRGWPPHRLPLGADIAVISALLQPPPPPRLALPSCVKTPVGFCSLALHPLAWPSQVQGGHQCLAMAGLVCRVGSGSTPLMAPVAGDRPQFPAWRSQTSSLCSSGLIGRLLRGLWAMRGHHCEPQAWTWLVLHRVP